MGDGRWEMEDGWSETRLEAADTACGRMPQLQF